MVEAMLRGWRAQQTARGLKEDTMVPRQRLVRRFLELALLRWLIGEQLEVSIRPVVRLHGRVR